MFTDGVNDKNNIIGLHIDSAIAYLNNKNAEFRVIKLHEDTMITADFVYDRYNLYVNNINIVYDVEIG